MTTLEDLKKDFRDLGARMIIAADAETVVHRTVDGHIVAGMAAGGVSTAFDPIAGATNAIYIARGKTEEDKKMVDKKGFFNVKGESGDYRLKRVFPGEKEFSDYYNGFSNQTLWPLSHVAYEGPKFKNEWYKGFKEVNKKFADSIKQEIKGKTFIWVNDYQLCLVPKYLNRPKNTTVALFWHIPWPTWETFRILPQKREILESLLACDFLAFHRGYHVRNFLNCLRREMEARIDEETNRVYYNGRVTTIKNLPMGIDTDIIKSIGQPLEQDGITSKIVENIFGIRKDEGEIDSIFRKNKVILGVDRMDYTKGLLLRFFALDKFFEQNKKYIGKVVYLGLLVPSREQIGAYKGVREGVKKLAVKINKKYGNEKWKPIHLMYDTLTRENVVSFYKRADVCLVTPRDDGMNLVSKEFVVAASGTSDPGMLVLSEFAGSAIDLTEALIINPYDFEGTANAVKQALEMKREEKKRRIHAMTEVLDEKNVYAWASDFISDASAATKSS